MIVEVQSLEAQRATYEEVAGLGPQGASPRGSTYWRRVQMCPREHLLANELHWEKTPRAEPLDIGLLWHGVLEHYYLGVQALQQGQWRPTTPEQDAFAFLQRFVDAPGWGAFYDTVSRMLEAYLVRWRHNTDWEILAVEWTTGWTAESHPELARYMGFENTTRLDLLIRDHSLRPVIRHVEHKSSRSLDPLTVQGYAQDDQVLGQCFLARYFIDWGDELYLGAIVNITTKAKYPLCERLPVQPSDEQLQAWADSKRFWASFRDQYETFAYPKNYATCTRRFGRCQFFDLCRYNPTDTPVTLRRRHELDELPAGFRKGHGPVLDEG